jgi:prepilin-type processing-associated H-X9-DG protein
MLYEVSGYQAAMSTPGETDSESGWGWTSYSPGNTGNNVPGLYQTGVLGTVKCQQGNGNFGADAYYAGLTGRHTDTANWLLCDGHVKALHGGTVTAGAPAQSPSGNCGGYYAAGTADLGSDPNGTFTATFSPI